jgi:hypothetical protein
MKMPIRFNAIKGVGLIAESSDRLQGLNRSDV